MLVTAETVVVDMVITFRRCGLIERLWYRGGLSADRTPARILLVEDEPAVAAALSETLRDLGYAVLGVAASASVAIARTRLERPDLVVMDIGLAGELDGIHVAEQIASAHAAPIIYVTAHSDDATLRRATATNPAGYLVKPFRGSDLRCAVEIALHRREIESRLQERKQWLAGELHSIGGDAPVGSSIAEALAGWGYEGSAGRVVADIGRLIGGPDRASAPGSPEESPTAHQLNRALEERVVERTRQLIAAQRELEAFTSSLARDLRAPLRGIDGFSQALIEDHAHHLGVEGRGHLDRIRAASARMGRLVDDLLCLSTVATTPLQRRAVDVSAIARAIGGGLQATHAHRSVEIVVAPGLVCDADPTLLAIALEKLLENAWRFTEPRSQGRVEVGTDSQDRSRIIVRDNGIGFDAKAAIRLFAAFERFDAGLSGNGLGLAIVQRIVARHGGRVSAESVPGGGATFGFALGEG